MGMIVRRFEDIIWALKSVPKEGKLFCFFAFDDRPSHRVVLDFLTDSRYWIDSLSASSGIFTLFFSKKWAEIKDPPGWMYMERPRTQGEANFLRTLPKEVRYINPTLELAKKFGVKPRSLPGLIIFEALSDESPTNSIYVPLSLSWFEKGQKLMEMVLAEMYSRIQEVYERSRSTSKEQLFDELAQSLTQIGRVAKPLGSLEEKLEVVISEVEDKIRSKPYSNLNTVPYLSKEEASHIGIFISYAREDQDKAKLLYEYFSEAALKPWLDTENILPGERWETSIEKAIRSCDFFIACLSKKIGTKKGVYSREFRETLKMWEEKLDDDIYLIPVRFDDCEVPDALRDFQWIDFSPHCCGWSHIMEAITEGVRRRQNSV